MDNRRRDAAQGPAIRDAAQVGEATEKAAGSNVQLIAFFAVYIGAVGVTMAGFGLLALEVERASVLAMRKPPFTPFGVMRHTKKRVTFQLHFRQFAVRQTTDGLRKFRRSSKSEIIFGHRDL
jgi:hypothetical protein